MKNVFRTLILAAAMLPASFSFVFADAALPPDPVEKTVPVAVPAAVVVAIALIVRAIRNKR